MAVDGDWAIIIKSPMGDMPSTLSLKAEGATLTGTQTGQGNTVPITDGVVDGDTLNWSSAITSPMPMILEFTGAVAGDTLGGSVKAGVFGSFPFSGGRA